ncbi:MAG: cytochrome c [Pirellulales bacterium]
MCSAAVLAAKPDGKSIKRARPPKWSNDVLDAFFEDARDKLVGPRPVYSQAPTVAAAANGTAATPPEIQSGATDAAWSKLIDAETIEAEIKRLAQAAADDVATPSKFKGGAYEDCRRHFSVLAMLFAVAAEYDGVVRWSDVAPALRDSFARAGYNCKVGTDQTYQESLNRSHDLAELIRGIRPQVPPAERAADWGQVSDRPPLMQRMEIAHQERLTKWLANERQFVQNRDEVRHEAQLLATIAAVIAREGFDYWDDEQYAQYARDLRQATSDIAAAAELENYDQAKQAISRATKACTNCHDGYRE